MKRTSFNKMIIWNVLCMLGCVCLVFGSKSADSTTYCLPKTSANIIGIARVRRTEHYFPNATEIAGGCDVIFGQGACHNEGTNGVGSWFECPGNSFGLTQPTGPNWMQDQKVL